MYWVSSNKGTSVTEFGLLVGLIAVLILATISVTGDRVNQLFSSNANSLNLILKGAPISAPPLSPPTWEDNQLTGEAYAQYPLTAPLFLAPASGENIQYQLTAGSLNGLILNSEPLQLTGTPTFPGTYNFTLTASNNGGSVSQDFTVTVDKFTDCQDVLASGYGDTNGEYALFLDDSNTISHIRCDMTTDGGGWTELIYGYGMPLSYFDNFNVIINDIPSLSGDPSYGVSWGAATTLPSPFYLGFQIDYSEVKITYSGFYRVSQGYLALSTSYGSSDLINFVDNNSSDSSGQNLHVYGIGTVLSNAQTNIIDRTDHFMRSGSALYIRMGRSSSAIYSNHRYIKSLKVR